MKMDSCLGWAARLFFWASLKKQLRYLLILYVGELVLQIRDEALVRNIQNDRTDFLHFWKYLLPFTDAILVQKTLNIAMYWSLPHSLQTRESDKNIQSSALFI